MSSISITLNLPEPIYQNLQQLVAEGKYSSFGDVVRAGLEALSEREKDVKERAARFQRVLSIAERNHDIPQAEIEADIAQAIDAVRGMG